jgi:hypothetical protein
MDFAPIENKIGSLLNEYKEEDGDYHALIAMSLGYYCYKNGINYSIVQSILKRNYKLWNHFKDAAPIKFVFNHDDKDYILPQNKLLATQILFFFEKRRPDIVHDVYYKIMIELAYYVNRKTIIRRTPESRLASQMMDIDNFISEFFGNDVGNFLLSIEKEWGWNSRYWEQRALYMSKIDIDKAIAHAEQAVSLDYHPYTLTTLSSILFKKMEMDTVNCIMHFEKAVSRALEAMREEDMKNMISIKPFMVLINGCIDYAKILKRNNINSHNKNNIRAALFTFEDEIRLTTTEKRKLDEVRFLLQD